MVVISSDRGQIFKKDNDSHLSHRSCVTRGWQHVLLGQFEDELINLEILNVLHFRGPSP